MSYQPAFDGVIASWTTKHLHQNQWRVRIICPTWNDLMQEAHLIFVVCRQRYCDTGRVVCMPHFMALYKTSLIHRVHRLAQKDSRIRSVESSPVDNDEGTDPMDSVGELENMGVLNVLLRQAPREVTLVLSLLAGAPSELLGIILGPKVTEAHLSKKLCKLLGLPPDCDPLAMTRAHFQGGQS